MIKKGSSDEETQGKHYEVDVRNIKPLNRAGGNIRLDYGDNDGSFKELINSIEANGIIVPLRGFRDKDNPEGWITIDGHSRLKAAMKLVNEKGLTIRAKIITVDARKISDEQIIIDMVVTNSGKPLNPMELSEAVRRLIIFGYKTKEIAIKFGMNNHAIKNLELLAAAPKRIRDLITENKLRYTVALDFIKTSPDFNEAIEKIDKAFSLVNKENQSTTGGSGEEKKVITRTHLNQVNNKVDSSMELKKVFKKQIDNPKEIKNQELYSFCKRIAENRLTSSDIEKLLF